MSQHLQVTGELPFGPQPQGLTKEITVTAFAPLLTAIAIGTTTATMAMRVSNSRVLASALSSSRNTLARRSEAGVRCFTSTRSAREVYVSPDQPRTRAFPRTPDPPAGIQAKVVNPADKYAAKAEDLHKYGQWLMGCLPKYIQQFTVWKDELVIYIPPSGVIPVFSFLKCE